MYYSMRKIFQILFLFVFSSAALAQNINRFEYFFDTDPGFGAGTIVNVTPSAAINDFNIPISTSSLTTGFHKLYIRAQNANNEWTHTHVRSFYIVPLATPSPNISQIEYFIDTDPGIGNATQVSFTAAATINNLAIDISAVPLTPGFHKLYVRSKSSDGQWTHTHLRSFYVTNVSVGQNLVEFEYFFDTDPGFDNGTSVAITPAVPSVTNQDIFADVSGISVGTHTINIRAKDSGGEWTQVSTGTFSVTVSLVPTITSFTPTSGVAGTTVTITGTNFIGATAVTFGGTAVASFNVVSATSITATTGAGATGKISVTTPNGTATSSSDYTFTLPDLISISTQPTSTAICEGSNATFTLAAGGTTNLTYQWQKFNGTAFTDIANGSTYSGVTSNSLAINTTGNLGAGDYRCKISGDNSLDKFSNTVTLTVNITPAAPATVDSSACGSATLTLAATGGSNGQYRWYTQQTNGTPISGEVNSTYTTPPLNSSANYYVSINNGTCESARTAVTATIFTAPVKPIITSNETITAGVIQLCKNAITLTAPAGFSYTWSNGATTQSITNVQPGNYSVIIKDGNNCSSASSDVIQVVLNNSCLNSPPVINTTALTTTIGGSASIDLTSLISDPDDNLDPSSLQVVGQTTQRGGKATLSGFILTLDYTGINFSGSDLITIRICDILGACVNEELAIEVVGEIIIYNGISPNGDGANDKWIIEYIDLLPDTEKNQVKIYNRWGDLVWEVSDYNNTSNVFTGTNKNGGELPTGTYFYKIEFAEVNGATKQTITGYLSLKR